MIPYNEADRINKEKFIMQEYIAMWETFANFSDRTSVRGYWMAFLYNFIISLVLGLVTSLIPFLRILAGLYLLAVLVPGLVIAVRRLRDTGREWYWILIAFIPVVGAVLLIVFLCKPTASTEGVQV